MTLLLCEVGQAGRVLREATPGEVRQADAAAALCAGGEGIIRVDGRACYVATRAPELDTARRWAPRGRP